MMLNITNRKIASFDVRWASFQGFSILFNNCGKNSFEERHSGIFHLVNNVNQNSSLNFYRILDEGVKQLNCDILMKKYLFCALPSSTYHVTLWGGLNYKYIEKINPQYRSMLENWFSTLPESVLDTPKDIIEYASMSSLCKKVDWNIHFQFDRLNLWNNSVLAASLRPHSNSISIFEDLCEERRRLNQQYYDRFGIFTDSEMYEPHVSLGYFANEEGAEKALDFVNQWNIIFNDALQNETLSFHNASIYALTDMITFFKVDDK